VLSTSFLNSEDNHCSNTILDFLYFKSHKKCSPFLISIKLSEEICSVLKLGLWQKVWKLLFWAVLKLRLYF